VSVDPFLKWVRRLNDSFVSSADGIAPIFIQKPIIKQEQDGKRLIFECKISADPKPDLIWTQDDKPLSDPARFLVSCDALPNNTYVACLQINNVISSDGGKYKVTAKNRLGESNANIGLNLDSKFVVLCLSLSLSLSLCMNQCKAKAQ
jgi:hypothetical protein